jgi:hypothetical protein
MLPIGINVLKQSPQLVDFEIIVNGQRAGNLQMTTESFFIFNTLLQIGIGMVGNVEKALAIIPPKSRIAVPTVKIPQIH